MAWDDAPPTATELKQPSLAWDATPPKPEELAPSSYWNDVSKNAGKEVEGMVKSAPALAEGGLKIASIPHDIVRYIAERGRGIPHEETALGQDLATVEGAIKSGPGATASMAKDLVHTVTDFKGSLREKPIATAGNVAMLLGGAGALVEKAAPAMEAAAETTSNALGRRATGFTKALIKGKNFEKANDAVQWMMDKKILTPGADTEEMLSRASTAKDEAWNSMKASMEEQNAGATGALSPKSKPQLREQFLFDPKKSIKDLEAMRPKAGNGKILTGGQYDQMNAQIDDAVATVKAHGDRPIPWDEANDLKGNLHANWDTTKSQAVNNLKKRIYGSFNDSMESQMDEAAQARGGNIDKFMQAKQDYGAAKTAEKALDNLRSSKSGNRIIGLTDHIAAVAGASGGVGGPAGRAVSGVAAFTIKKAIEKYGLTGGATLAQKLSVLASKAPEVLGPYAPAIKTALAAGGTDLAFTHGILAKKDPNYRALLSELAAAK